jgi:formimidoylglutamate deiminase
VFAGNRPLVRETHVAGQRVVAEGRHRDAGLIADRYRRTLADLLAGDAHA